MAEITNIIQEKVKRYGSERRALLPILQGIVKEQNYIKQCDMVSVARALDISAADVYGVASFYSFLEGEKKGEYVIRLCKSITCEMKGRNKIQEKIENLLNIKVGETTHDNKFTLLKTNCIGLCDQGPAMLINEEPYTFLEEDTVSEIIHKYRQLKTK